jgi:hypothetical protein
MRDVCFQVIMVVGPVPRPQPSWRTASCCDCKSKLQIGVRLQPKRPPATGDLGSRAWRRELTTCWRAPEAAASRSMTVAGHSPAVSTQGVPVVSGGVDQDLAEAELCSW